MIPWAGGTCKHWWSLRQVLSLSETHTQGKEPNNKATLPNSRRPETSATNQTEATTWHQPSGSNQVVATSWNQPSGSNRVAATKWKQPSLSSASAGAKVSKWSKHMMNRPHQHPLRPARLQATQATLSWSNRAPCNMNTEGQQVCLPFWYTSGTLAASSASAWPVWETHIKKCSVLSPSLFKGHRND